MQAATVMKKQVFSYEADTHRLEKALKMETQLPKKSLKSYAKAEFFTQLPDIEEEIRGINMWQA